MNINKIKNSFTDGTFNFYLKDKMLRKKFKENYNIVHDLHTLIFLEKKYNSFLKELPILPESTEEKPKIIWWCWLQGEENAPVLCRKCLDSLRKNYPDYQINIVTSKNLYDYIDFPEYIKEKYSTGVITHTHFSDLIRVQLLIKYGGIWIDSSVYCTGRSEYIEQSPFFVYKSFLNANNAMSASSWLISANKNNPILITTRDLLFEYWKSKKSLINYFLFHICFTIARRKYPQIWEDITNIPNTLPHILQFEMLKPYSSERMKEIKRLYNFHKLSQKIIVDEKSINGSYYFKIINGEEL